MDKRYFTPIELMQIATQHAWCADNLLHEYNTKSSLDAEDGGLLPIISLMYVAFDLTLRAYLLHVQRPVKQEKNLSELLELNKDLVFSNQDLHRLKHLSRLYAFRKGIDYELWEDIQDFQVFCSELLKLYEELQQMMPLELQADYQQ